MHICIDVCISLSIYIYREREGDAHMHGLGIIYLRISYTISIHAYNTISHTTVQHNTIA